MSFKQKVLRLVFRLWAKPIRTFDSKFLGTIFRTDCNYVSIETSSWKLFSLKKRYFFPNLLLFLSGIFSCFRRTFYGRVDKSAFYMSEGHFMENKLFEKVKLLKFYGFWAICFWDLAWSFNRVAKISHFVLVLGDFFEEKLFFWKKFHYIIFFGLRAKSYRPDFLNNFRRFRRKFLTEKTFLFEKSCLFPVYAKVFSGYLGETFWQDGQNCTSIVQRIMITGKKCFFENIDFFLKFWLGENLVRKVCGNFSPA